MNTRPVVQHYARYHPDLTPDVGMWSNVLVTCSPTELVDALHAHACVTGAEPTPAGINALIRQARGQEAATEARGRADAARLKARAEWDERKKTLGVKDRTARRAS